MCAKQNLHLTWITYNICTSYVPELHWLPDVILFIRYLPAALRYVRWLRGKKIVSTTDLSNNAYCRLNIFLQPWDLPQAFYKKIIPYPASPRTDYMIQRSGSWLRLQLVVIWVTQVWNYFCNPCVSSRF
jgi:hypothetical protein